MIELVVIVWKELVNKYAKRGDMITAQWSLMAHKSSIKREWIARQWKIHQFNEWNIIHSRQNTKIMWIEKKGTFLFGLITRSVLKWLQTGLNFLKSLDAFFKESWDGLMA